MTWTRAVRALVLVVGGALVPGCPPIRTAPPLLQSSEFGPPTLVAEAFVVPSGLGVDAKAGRILVADTGSHRVKAAAIASLVAAPAWSEFGYVADRTASDALDEPQGIAGDGAGNFYVADTFRGRLLRFVPSGDGYARDPAFALASANTAAGVPISLPRDVAVGPDGTIYLLDTGNNRLLSASGPSATAWQVWRGDLGLLNPYGLDVARDGTIYIADTGDHRIVKVTASGAPTFFGGYGSGGAFLNGPRDIAVAADGKLIIADTGNHRVVVLTADGRYYSRLVDAPLVDSPQKVSADPSGRIFVLDSVRQRLVAFVGAAGGAPFDLYVRDYVGDIGSEPSTSSTLSSPDLLLRQAPDVDVDHPPSGGLESIPFQQPQFGQGSYLYVAVHNRGLHLSPPASVRLFWGDPLSPLAFPHDWSPAGFFGPDGKQNNTLLVPSVPARQAGIDGVVMVGPLLFKPPLLKGQLNPSANVDLFVRIVALDDPTRPTTPSGYPEIQESNNVAMRVVPVGCTPQCAGKSCGSDQCGGVCGACGASQSCTAAGLCVCVPNCGGRQCGSDGCGGQCGACQGELVCKVGLCVADPCAACGEGETCVQDRCVSQGCGRGCPAGWQCGDDEKCHRCLGSACQ